MVSVGDFSNDCQTKPSAAQRTASRRISALEALEELLARF
jgi:hypothetical protein